MLFCNVNTSVMMDRKIDVGKKEQNLMSLAPEGYAMLH